jgi:hypothetical protein
MYGAEKEFKQNFGDRKETIETVWKRERIKQLKLNTKDGTLKAWQAMASFGFVEPGGSNRNGRP